MSDIKVTKKEVEDFLYTSKRDNAVRQFWREVVKELPNELQQELRRKPTNLKLDKEEKGTSVWRFITHNASEKLHNLVSDNHVIVQ